MKLFGQLLLFLLMLNLCFATVVVNSLDTRDVISAVYYAVVTNDGIGIVYPGYGLDNVYSTAGSGNVFLIQSSSRATVLNLGELLAQRGNGVDTLVSEDPYKTNIQLAQKSGAESFVLLDPVYGYNAVSVLPYAKLNRMYALLVGKNNTEEIVSFLQAKRPKSILIYGPVGNDIKEGLNNRGLRYVEIDNGDKYDDNLRVLDMYFSQNPAKKQVILCDGSGIEDTIASGDDPVVFISQIVPQDTYNYIKQKVETGQISVGLVVDADYLQTSYNLKERINRELGSKKLSVLVKIGQSVAEREGTPSPVPFIQLSSPVAGLAIEKIEYNTDKKAFEVTYVNTGNAQEYAKSTLIVFVDGNYTATTGDAEAFEIPKGSKIGREYKVDVGVGKLTVNITSYYGISKKNPDFGIAQTFTVGRISYVDKSVVEITDIKLDRGTKELFVTFLNNGTIGAYVLPSVSLVGESTISVAGEKIYLQPNEGKTARFLLPSTEVEKIIAKADYGAREGFLEKHVEKEYVPPAWELDMNYVYIAIILLLVAVVAYLLMEKKKNGGNTERSAETKHAPAAGQQ